MTKRKHKAHGAKGFNQSLGKSLLNSSKKTSFRNSHSAQSQDLEKGGLESRTFENDMQEFLHNAELANANFEAEKNDIKIIESTGNSAILLEDFDKRSLEELHAKYGHLLRIPRRPEPGTYNDAEELNALESAEFLDWRRQVAKLEESNGVVVTPFERNLEIWRQLWRVIERSHVVVQIVDARNPLLFRSADLEKYVKEVDSTKQNMLLINKSDLLTPEQIRCWNEYFIGQGIDPIFWSAKLRNDKRESIDELSEEEEQVEDEEDEEANDTAESNVDSDESNEDEEDNAPEAADSDGKKDLELEDEEKASLSEDENEEISNEDEEADENSQDATYISSPEELIDQFRQRAALAFPRLTGGFVIGMVGYPNVGKSSTINQLLGVKKTSVSATPGKTKHFQTIVVDDEITLCDCPGLVMPSFGLSNSEMVLNGILPIAHMRHYYSPVQLLCNRVPRPVLQQRYSILLPKQQQNVQAHDLLTSIAFLKGFMSASGIPDCSRAARLVLTDVVQGSLKWCAAPPGIPQEQFDQWTFEEFQSEISKKRKTEAGSTLLEQLERRELLLDNGSGRNTRIDRDFFDELQRARQGSQVAHVKGGIGRLHVGEEDGKGRKKHFNRNKRQKLRRVFAVPN